VHVCHRPDNPNRAEAKTKHPWRMEAGTVTGGLIKRVSPPRLRVLMHNLVYEPDMDRPATPAAATTA